MEIIVQGKGESKYTPNRVIFNLRFNYNERTYNSALEGGANMVFEYVEKILKPNGFTEMDMKTNRFVVRQKTKYNDKTKNYDFDGYTYNQEASIEFDYDKAKVTKLMEEISELKNPPSYDIDFTVSDIKACKQDVLTMAYKDAEEQANIIALAAGKKLVRCVKVDFKPFTTSYISEGFMAEREMCLSKACSTKGSAAATINAVFTPEDVVVNETLYCLWLAE